MATAEIQSQFMGSAGHNANILGKAWDVIGIGAYKGPTGKKMWTVLFADKCGTTTATPKPTAEADAQADPPADAATDGAPDSAPDPAPDAATDAQGAADERTGRDPEPTPDRRDEPSPTPPTSDPAAHARRHPRPDRRRQRPADRRLGRTDPGSDERPDRRRHGHGRQRPACASIDRGSSDGLLDTIVGGVAGFFFGG